MAPRNQASETVRNFDGVICFGGVDWWYHNRGHYDLQMMRELSKSMPVLYVNSLAMRVPKLTEGGGMFFKRVKRKLKSLGRGMTVVRENFGVFSPFAVPGKLGTRVSQSFAPLQIRQKAKALGIRKPLVWVACPPAAQFVNSLGSVGLVYQRTDRFEAFAGVDPVFIGACSDQLVRDSDIVLYCSRLLMEEEQAKTPNACFIDHGVDFTPFEAAGLAAKDPADVADLPRPRVGFIGGIDIHTFDPELFNQVVRMVPEAQFFLVGACSLPDDWCTAPNVHLLGQRPYEEVAAYMAAADVLIMPWNQSEWIRACNPVKLKEYLAVGRPVVTTDFYELKNYTGLVRVAKGAEAFANDIRAALAEASSPDAGRDRVREETWENKGKAILDELARHGLVHGS